MSSNAKKKVVLVEDDPEVRKIIRETLSPYFQDIKVFEATNAGVAMNLLFPDPPDNRPDALILDLMMPYGEAGQELDSDSDHDQIK
ncbi:MAG: response regulator transcription factor, partial [Deltaproteobacteria bacterium]|nr:response regulator transcription factor [Deltaproteobacteria bacterium]